MLGLIQTKIQKGRTTGGTITIEEVSDINKCIVLVDGGATAYLSSTTSLVVTLAVNKYYSTTTNTAGTTSVSPVSYNPVGTVSWTVIELGGAIVE